MRICAPNSHWKVTDTLMISTDTGNAVTVSRSTKLSKALCPQDRHGLLVLKTPAWFQYDRRKCVEGGGGQNGLEGKVLNTEKGVRKNEN